MLEPEITIRPATTADAGAVARLIEPGFARFIAPALSIEARVAFRLYVTNKALRARLGEGAVAWCAVVAGRNGEQRVGYAELRGGDGRVGGLEHLALLFTAIDHQGQGIARRLVETVIAHVSTGDPAVCTLTVNASTFALPIYRRLGFIPSLGNAGEGGIVATQMHRALIPASPSAARPSPRPCANSARSA